MDVTKVVGLAARSPKHFSLNFSDFSTILYGIYNFAVFENQRKRKRTFASRPLDFCFFSGEVLGGRDSTEEGRAAGFPVFLLACGKGDVGEKVEGTETNQ